MTQSYRYCKLRLQKNVYIVVLIIHLVNELHKWAIVYTQLTNRHTMSHVIKSTQSIVPN